MNRQSAPPQIFLDDLQAHKASVHCQSAYGTAGGDPKLDTDLVSFVQRYIQPYVRSDKVATEIGSGGGRMTQLLAGFKTIYAVDIHPEMHEALQEYLDLPYLKCILSDGSNYPGMGLTDYVLAFKVFDFFGERELVDSLQRLAAHLNEDAEVVFTYANVANKCRNEHVRSYTTIAIRDLISEAGYVVRVEDPATLKDRYILRISLAPQE